MQHGISITVFLKYCLCGDSEVEMKNIRSHLLIVGVGSLIVLFFISIIFSFNRTSEENTLPPAAAELSEPALTSLYMDGSIIRFYCLDTSKCFPDVDLGDPIKTLNDPNAHPLSLWSAYYGNDSMIYLVIGGSIWAYLIEINPQTSQVRYLDINVPSLSSRADDLPMFLPAGLKMIHGKIVIGTTDGKIGIMQDDLSLKTIDLKEPIRNFIEVNDSQAAFVSQLQNDKKQGKVFLVDVNSGMVEEKIFNDPQEDGQIITVDSGIHNLYWVSSENKTLHLFNIQAQKDVRSIPISDGDFYAYSTLTVPLYQYHGILYSGGGCPCEGPSFPSMRDMSTLKPVVNPQDFIEKEEGSIGTFIIAPFGDNFLIGMTNHVLVVAPNGTVVKTYDLPKELVGRNYLLLEYRK